MPQKQKTSAKKKGGKKKKTPRNSALAAAEKSGDGYAPLSPNLHHIYEASLESEMFRTNHGLIVQMENEDIIDSRDDLEKVSEYMQERVTRLVLIDYRRIAQLLPHTLEKTRGLSAELGSSHFHDFFVLLMCCGFEKRGVRWLSWKTSTPRLNVDSVDFTYAQAAEYMCRATVPRSWDEEWSQQF